MRLYISGQVRWDIYPDTAQIRIYYRNGLLINTSQVKEDRHPVSQTLHQAIFLPYR